MTLSTPPVVLLDLAVATAGPGAPWLPDAATAAEVAEAAERAGITALRILDETPDATTLDATVLAGHLAGRTSTLGYLVDVRTSHHAPYNLARRLLSLDRASGGRTGLVLRPGEGDEVSAAVAPDPAASDPALRWQEYAAILLRLWESFPAEALVGDQEAGVFVRDELIAPISHDGSFYRVNGALDGPSSVQVRPLHVVADTDVLSWDQVAATADLVIVDRDRAPGADQALGAALRRVGRDRADVALVGRTAVDPAVLRFPQALTTDLRSWAGRDGLDGFDLVPLAEGPGSVGASALAILETVVPLLGSRTGATLREATGSVPAPAETAGAGTTSVEVAS
ncbi:LLM class flavin-dependent oxidoreductase [Nocardioides sp. NPDC057577]|uniref:LLM class flavin-dependent oxidoreductase n=1 Tax=Nocardioides sp. NPDC057577 TaxID=3346171 RepID=UPI00366C4498